MVSEINRPLILIAHFVATASPGPAILAIAGTSMTLGRRQGLAIAFGVTTGSWIWSTTAAFGLGTLMLSNAWLFEVIRYCGGGYLLYLAFNSMRNAITSNEPKPKPVIAKTFGAAYWKGVAIHLTNPKAVMFFGSLFAIGVPTNSSLTSLGIVMGTVGLQSLIVFHAYALIFSTGRITSAYIRLRRWFEAAFAVAFGAAGLRILSARFQ
jgi:threonine/homoserine/homoserine lactone efflux protein